MNKQTRLKSISGAMAVIAVCGLMLGMAAAAQAAAISGRAAIWSYLRDDSVDHVQIVPLLSLTAHQIGSPALSLETSVRGFVDYRNGEANDEAIRLHRAVLVYKPAASKLQARLGQQWMSEGVARGNVLGLWGRYAFGPRLKLIAFGGSRLPNSISLDESIPNEGYSLGLNARTYFTRAQLGLSYFYVARGSDPLFQGVGLDATLKVNPTVRVRGRLHMNLEQSAIETAELAGQWQPTDQLMVSVLGRNAAPRVFEDSFFATFLDKASNSSLRGACRWTFEDDVYLSTAATTVLTEGDPLYKVRAGIGVPEIEVGYTHWLSADQGDMDGFYGQTVAELLRSFDVNAGFDYSRGSNSEVRPNTESQAIWAGCSWTPTRAVGLSARGEHLRDAAHSDDWRALLSISSNFTTLK